MFRYSIPKTYAQGVKAPAKQVPSLHLTMLLHDTPSSPYFRTNSPFALSFPSSLPSRQPADSSVDGMPFAEDGERWLFHGCPSDAVDVIATQVGDRAEQFSRGIESYACTVIGG